MAILVQNAEEEDSRSTKNGTSDEDKTGTPPASASPPQVKEAFKDEYEKAPPQDDDDNDHDVKGGHEGDFRSYLRRTSAHGLSRIVKRSDWSRFVWIVLCIAIYGITVLIFGLMAKNYADPAELVIQLELEEVGCHFVLLLKGR